MNTTDREKLLERIDHTIYQLQYPPLNGGPDQDDIMSLLWACYNALDEDNGTENHNEDLNDIIDDAISDLRGIIDSLEARRNG